MTEKREAQRCRHSIEGPPIHKGRLVLWRRPCKNRTTDPSGYCHVHRKEHDYD